MAHSRVQGGVHIEDKKTSYQMNPGVGYTLGGGFHCTTFDNIAQIFREGLRPGGGGDRINTFFVPFAPWDVRSQMVLRFRKIDQTDLVYIYITYDSSPSSPLDYQQTDTFGPRNNSIRIIRCSLVLRLERKGLLPSHDHEGKRDQLVLSVQGAKRVATIERFDKLIGNIVPEESSPDLDELRKLVDIRTGHFSHTHRLFTWTSGLE